MHPTGPLKHAEVISGVFFHAVWALLTRLSVANPTPAILKRCLLPLDFPDKGWCGEGGSSTH